MNKKIGIIGDVHAEDVLLSLAINWFEKQGVDIVVCTGDIADGLGDINAACDLLANHGVLTVAGNHDRWLLTDKKRHVKYAHRRSAVRDSSLQFMDALPKMLSVSTSCGELLLCHGVLGDDLAKVWPGTATTDVEQSLSLDQLLSNSSTAPRFIVNGHMHFRTLIDFESCQLINAGTLKGLYSGFSILDVDEQMVSGFDFTPDKVILPGQYHSVAGSDGRKVWRNTQAFNSRWTPVTLHRSP